MSRLKPTCATCKKKEDKTKRLINGILVPNRLILKDESTGRLSCGPCFMKNNPTVMEKYKKEQEEKQKQSRLTALSNLYKPCTTCQKPTTDGIEKANGDFIPCCEKCVYIKGSECSLPVNSEGKTVVFFEDPASV